MSRAGNKEETERDRKYQIMVGAFKALTGIENITEYRATHTFFFDNQDDIYCFQYHNRAINTTMKRAGKTLLSVTVSVDYDESIRDEMHSLCYLFFDGRTVNDGGEKKAIRIPVSEIKLGRVDEEYAVKYF